MPTRAIKGRSSSRAWLGYAALATPLTAAGDVDFPAFVAHAQYLMYEGCDGVVPFGTTGEGTSFSAPERLQDVEALLARGIAPGQIALGAGFPALPDIVALIRSALALGITHMLVLPPYFYRDVAPAGLEAAFSRMIDAVADDRLRVTLYHIPQVSGVATAPATLELGSAGRGGVGGHVAGADTDRAGPATKRALLAVSRRCFAQARNSAGIGRFPAGLVSCRERRRSVPFATNGRRSASSASAAARS